MPLPAQTRSIYEYALEHLKTHKAEIESRIEYLRNQLGITLVPPVGSDSQSTRKRTPMSAEGRARVSAAQHKRWTAVHAAQKKGTVKKGK